MNRALCTPTARTSARILSAPILSTPILAALALVVGAGTLTAQEAPQRHVRAKDGGAKLYNLADSSSIAIATLPAKTLLEVYDERAGYLSVDAPGGMEVWVYGEYLRPTGQPGTVEITGSSVLMRPLPKADESAYPLEQRLHKGDRVRAIGRNDPAKPLANDWVRIVTPPGTRAWVLASDTTPVDPQENVQSAWNEAVRTDRAARAAFDVTAGGGIAGGAGKAGDAAGDAKPTDAAKPADAAATPQAKESFAAAEALYESARSTPGADWAAVRAAYQRYLDKNPDGAMAAQARARLEKVELHAEIERIRNDRSLLEAQRGEKLADAERRLREANISQDPLMGRFQARGYLVREQPVASQPPRYVVFWAGEPRYEIVCASGRYDLSVFDQYEIGVQGAVMRSRVEESETVAARPGRIDVARIEVLSARARP